MFSKIPTLELKFDSHLLPLGSSWIEASLPFAIWKVCSDTLDEESQFSTDHPKNLMLARTASCPTVSVRLFQNRHREAMR